MTRLKIYRGDKTSLESKDLEDGAIYIAPTGDDTFEFAADVLKDGNLKRYKLQNNLSDEYIQGTLKTDLKDNLTDDYIKDKIKPLVQINVEMETDEYGEATEKLIIGVPKKLLNQNN